MDIRVLRYFLTVAREESFSKAADEIGMADKMVLNVLDDVAENLEKALAMAADELTNLGFEQAINIKKMILESGGYRNIS